MALSDDKLWDLWNAQGTDDMSRVEALTFARAIEAEVRKELHAEIAELRRSVHALTQINSAQKELLDAMNVSK